MFSKLKKGYEEQWQAIIRPPRSEYTVEDLGPSIFFIEDVCIKRTDIEVQNYKGLKLQCSWFQQLGINHSTPCVIYLHGNSSSRLEALNYVAMQQPDNVSLFCFDFSGSGMSEGEYISLGYYEKDDLECIIKYLRETGDVTSVALWGRSMGAVTALMHADKDPTIAGLVLDSPFTSLSELSFELAKKYTSIPEFVVSIAMSYLKKTVKEKANFKIEDQDPLKNNTPLIFTPGQFICAKDDELINPNHTQRIYDAYPGDKNLQSVEGTHNSDREKYVNDAISIFFHQCQRVEEQAQSQAPVINCNQTTKNNDMNTWDEMALSFKYMQENGYLDEMNNSINVNIKNLGLIPPPPENNPKYKPGQNNNEKFNKGLIKDLAKMREGDDMCGEDEQQKSKKPIDKKKLKQADYQDTLEDIVTPGNDQDIKNFFMDFKDTSLANSTEEHHSLGRGAQDFDEGRANNLPTMNREPKYPGDKPTGK